MREVKVALTSIIKQENESETFHKTGTGTITSNGEITRINYLEDGLIPVKILLRPGKMILRRGGADSAYSWLRFVPGEKSSCKYVVSGRQMDLTANTKLLQFSATAAGSQELRVEYDLFSGPYLICDYAVTLIFT